MSTEWNSVSVSRDDRKYRSKEETERQGYGKKKYAEKDSALKIPLISKKMNSIEKYISQFDFKHVDVKDTSRVQISQHSKYLENSTERELLKHYRSVDVRDLEQRDDVFKSAPRNCVKYSSIADQSSEQRLEKLSKLQKDYSLLKEKLNPLKKAHSGDNNSHRSPQHQQIQQKSISDEDVQKQIKNTIINQNGKKYFADLYLLKKGRQNIMNSLSNVGKLTLGASTNDPMSQSQLSGKMTYEQNIKTSEKDFVSVLQDRETKRSKMMKARNLHWNVYYDMLALSASERQKLKGLCKFSSTFGIA